MLTYYTLADKEFQLKNTKQAHFTEATQNTPI